MRLEPTCSPLTSPPPQVTTSPPSLSRSGLTEPLLHFPSLHSPQTEHIQSSARILASICRIHLDRSSALATNFASLIMSSPWKKQPEDVVDCVLKRAEVSKVSEGMHAAFFYQARRNLVAPRWNNGQKNDKTHR